MRRALPALLATAAGLVLLLSFHTSAEPATVTSPKVGSSSTSTTVPTVPGAAPPTTAVTGLRTATGTEVDNRYGPVQVRITVDGSRLTDVVALQLPNDRPHSERLSAQAGPVLRSEALRAQSARVDVVSGATFTSESYAQSLQSALDQVGLGG